MKLKQRKRQDLAFSFKNDEKHSDAANPKQSISTLSWEHPVCKKLRTGDRTFAAFWFSTTITKLFDIKSSFQIFLKRIWLFLWVPLLTLTINFAFPFSRRKRSFLFGRHIPFRWRLLCILWDFSFFFHLIFFCFFYTWKHKMNQKARGFKPQTFFSFLFLQKRWTIQKLGSCSTL